MQGAEIFMPPRSIASLLEKESSSSLASAHGSAPSLACAHGGGGEGEREEGRGRREEGRGKERGRGEEGRRGGGKREGEEEERGEEGSEIHVHDLTELILTSAGLTKVDVGISSSVKNTSKSSHQMVMVEMSHTSAPAGRSKVRSCPVYLVPRLNAPVLSPLENKQA